MAKKVRSDNTYLLSGTERKDNPKLYARILPNGIESLYLEYYMGCNNVDGVIKVSRHKEILKGLYLHTNPRTPVEREHNNQTIEVAKGIRDKRANQFTEQQQGYSLKEHKKVDFLEYFQSYIDGYTKKDIRMMQIALQRFKDFLSNTTGYKMFAKGIKPDQLTKDMMFEFTDYLKSRSVGEGAKSIYQRFKKVVKYAVEHDVMRKNPCNGISIKIDDNILTKDVLSQDEIIKLVGTHYTFESPIIRRAFIFSLYSGLRYCDVKGLTYGNVDYSNRTLSFVQNKTKDSSSNSGVVIPLNDGLLSLLGQPKEGEGKDTVIFPLPTHEACNQALKRWVSRAGIDKKITWHCARHSFATNILNNGANIKTVASLMGHSSLKYTEKYTRAVDRLKAEAINSLPALDTTTI